ncbi:transporter substrate-binding protein [Oscillatoria sp. FACHB-1406]|uniref:transporter substrate-binding protein n=1 Tax=Oscillatoria sp. FACHB-1406 TaxID=2692846 RepID=UPI00168568D4|nr:transporter substrate-binding protein [Oscillatoria sp. FACHB-1406]MBD2580020.1 transporter substrate-binding protein [Oscillatoria sp. FACHB-1406]
MSGQTNLNPKHREVLNRPAEVESNWTNSSVYSSIQVGILDSKEDSLARSATLMAIAQINEQGGLLGRTIEPIAIENLAQLQTLLQSPAMATLFGAWTVEQRKTAIPWLERYDALLWCPAPNEELDNCDRIFYTGVCPNQLVELTARWLFEQQKHCVYLLGSDELFSKTSHYLLKKSIPQSAAVLHDPLLRLQLERQGGIVVGEDYLAPNRTDFTDAIARIQNARPDLIINTLNRNSQIAFYQQLHQAGISPQQLPTLAFNLSQIELQELGETAIGHYSLSTYFPSLDSAGNRQFIADCEKQFGTEKLPSASMVAAYTQVQLWKQAVELAESFKLDRVAAAAYSQRCIAPNGIVTLETNHHLSQPIYIGRIDSPNLVEIVARSDRALKPLPSLGHENEQLNLSTVLVDVLEDVSQWVRRSHELEIRNRELEVTISQLQNEIASRQQMEDAMLNYGLKLRALFTALEESIFITDARGVFLNIAPTNPQNPYKPTAELLGKCLHDLFEASLADAFLQHLQKTLETGETLAFEYCLPSDRSSPLSDGETWFSVRLSPIVQDESVVWVVREITEQKRLEKTEAASKRELERECADRTAALLDTNDHLIAEVVQHRQTANILQATRSQLQAILEAVPGIVSWISSDLHYLGVNRHLAKTFGLSVETFVGQPIGFLQASSGFDDFLRGFFASDNNEVSYEIAVNVGGQQRHYQIVAQKYDGGRAAFTIGIDISDRVRATESLSATKAQLEAVLEAVPGIVSWISSDLRYLGVNRHLAKTFGLSVEAFVGQPLGFLQGSSGFDEFLREFFACGDYEVSREVCTRVGNKLRYYQIVAQKYDEGRAAFIIGIDISDRVRASENLSATRNQLATLLDAVPGVVSWISSDLRYLGVNRHLANTFGLSVETFVGQPIGFLQASSSFDEFVREFFACGDNEVSREIATRVGNQTRHYLIVAQKYDEGRAAFTIGIDVSDRIRAIEGLRQAEEKYRVIFENTVEGIYQTTPDGRYLSANPALARIYGYNSPEQLVNEIGSIERQLYVNPERRQQFVDLIQERTAIVGFESQIYRRDGTLTWISENARAVRDTEGKILYYEGTVEDIYERKQAEETLRQLNEELESRVIQRTEELQQLNHQLILEIGERQRIESALRQSEAELKALFAAMTDVISVFDAEGRYVKIIATNSELLYSPTDDRIGKTVHEVFPHEIADLFLRQIQQVLQTNKTGYVEYSLMLDSSSHLSYLPSSSHTTKSREVWFAASISPLPDNCVIWVARNITERRRVVKAIQEAEEKYRSIFENAAEGIFQSTPDGQYLSANPALVKMFGYETFADMAGNVSHIGRQLYVHPQQRVELLERVEREGAVSGFQVRIYRKDGKRIWISENVRVVRDEQGNTMYYEGTAQDITQRKRAEDALYLEREKSERLLLNILPKRIAERLKQEPQAIAERFDQVSILFADIVNFTQLSARTSPTDLVKMLNQIFSAFDRLAQQYGLEKIKTIGDAYMVAGGFSGMSGLQSARAIADMALAMQQTILEFHQDNGEPFCLRVGINSGPVVAGVIGMNKFIYDLWGDTVNIASRMESHGLPGKIQVTAQTYDLLCDLYSLEPRGLIEVKGRGGMMTYWLLEKFNNNFEGS